MVFYAIREKGITPAIAIMDALASVAAVVHCGYDCVAPDGDRLPCTLNTIVVAPSSSGKGRSIKLFFAHFLHAYKHRERRKIERDKTGKPIGCARKPLVEAMMGKASFRALMEALDGNGMNLTIQCEEGASFLKTDLFKERADALTQVWSGDPPLDHFVHGVDLSAADARCSIGFRIQPDLMTDFLLGGGRLTYKLGFWPRAIAGCHDPERFPHNQTYRPASIPKTTPEAYQARMAEVATEINARNVEGFNGRTGVELGPEAKAFMLELLQLMKEWTATFYRDIREAAGRAWENTLRIAVALHVFCVGTGQVTRDMVECAWAIVEWSLSQHHLIFVEAVHPRKKQAMPSPATPVKLSQHQRRLTADCQFLIEVIAARAHANGWGQVRISELQLLCGFEDTRFHKTLAWVTNERHAIVEGFGEWATIRLTPPGSDNAYLGMI
jgi:hypothetical protein